MMVNKVKLPPISAAKSQFFLRIAVGAVFTFFALTTLLDPVSASLVYVPQELAFFRVTWLLMALGLVQLCLAVCLFWNKRVKLAALLGAVLLLPIILFLGLGGDRASMMRDIVIFASCLVVASNGE